MKYRRKRRVEDCTRNDNSVSDHSRVDQTNARLPVSFKSGVETQHIVCEASVCGAVAMKIPTRTT
jgi:hypothetical protein